MRLFSQRLFAHFFAGFAFEDQLDNEYYWTLRGQNTKHKNHNLYHCDRFPVNCRIIFHRHHAVNAFKPAQKFTYCSGIHQEKHKWNRKIQLGKTNCFYGHLSIGITLSSSKNHHLHLCTLNKYMRTNSLFSTMPSSLPDQVLFPEDSPQWLLRPT